MSAPISYWVLNQTSDSMSVCFAYSIPYSQIVFVKQGRGSSDFAANLTFSLDAVDSISGVNHHASHSVDVTTDNFQSTQSKDLMCQDFLLLTLPRSTYDFTEEIADYNQQITYSDYRHPHPIRPEDDLLTSVFIDSTIGSDFFPCTTHNTASFPGQIEAVVISNASKSSVGDFAIETIKGETLAVTDSVVARKGTIEPYRHGGVVSFTEEPDSSFQFYIVKFKSDTIRQGLYRLSARFGSERISRPFSYAWLDMPSSLRDFKKAMSLLKMIVPDSIFSEINSGNDEEVRRNFDSYWRAHDPTPETAYNELEAEFYQRADYATDHFRTVSEYDGAVTDRGKAYIVYGKPASITRELRSDGSYEIWKYPNLKRDFVFKEQGYGDFILYETEKI